MKPSTLIPVLTLMITLPAFAADMPGSSDHPLIPRVSGTEIYGYGQSGYDAGTFVSAVEDRKPVVDSPEGKRTRILYLAKPGDSPLMVQKNYETALQELGEVQEIYTCREKDCPAHPMVGLFWNADAVLETEGLSHPFYLMGFSHVIKAPSYRYVQVVKDGSQIHVGVFAVSIADNNANANVRGQTAVLLEILEVQDFEPTLEFVDATEMQSEIDAKGHIALYGIHFDHDKDSLRKESNSTIAEIVKVLQANAGLTLYVVGHTDGVGTLSYNQDLSKRRSQNVVNALIQSGVAADRLTPIGIGPVAPIATNDTDAGREMNRRVELVKRP